MCFYLLSTHLKGLVCVVGVFFAVQKSPYRTLLYRKASQLAQFLKIDKELGVPQDPLGSAAKRRSAVPRPAKTEQKPKKNPRS